MNPYTDDMLDADDHRQLQRDAEYEQAGPCNCLVEVHLSDGRTRWVSDDLDLTTRDGDASLLTREEADEIAKDFSTERVVITKLEGAA